jgi:hypothetical protein
MNRKTIMALAAAAALSIGFASAAKADPHISFGIGFGGGTDPSFAVGYSDGYGYPGYPGYGYYNADYGGDCGFAWVKHKHWNWNHTYKIVTMKKQWVCN